VPRLETSSAGPSAGIREGHAHGREQREHRCHEILQLRVGAERIDRVPAVEAPPEHVDGRDLLSAVEVDAEHR
jgi:hypothetical protein